MLAWGRGDGDVVLLVVSVFSSSFLDSRSSISSSKIGHVRHRWHAKQRPLSIHHVKIYFNWIQMEYTWKIFFLSLASDSYLSNCRNWTLQAFHILAMLNQLSIAALFAKARENSAIIRMVPHKTLPWECELQHILSLQLTYSARYCTAQTSIWPPSAYYQISATPMIQRGKPPLNEFEVAVRTQSCVEV